MNLPPLGIRLRASSIVVGDEKTRNLLIVRCGFPLWLCRPFFNRHKARSLHTLVVASVDTSAYHRQVRLRLRHGGSDVALVKDLLVIRPSLDHFVKQLLNIYNKLLQY
jgi:hypothetical protein